MKKLIAALAVLTVAAVAQAELLNTWTFANGESSGTKNDQAENIGQVSFGELTRNNVNNPNATAGYFGANNFLKDNAANNISFTVNVNSGYEIAESAIIGTFNNNNSGPANLQVRVNSTDIEGALWGVGANKEASIGTISGNNTIYLYRSGAAQNGGTSDYTAGRINITKMTFDGKVQEATSVPEPATMSLLGLGALAMVLRRKLRK